MAERYHAITVAILLGSALFLISAWIHLWLIGLAKITLRSSRPGAIRLSVSYLIILASHLLIASLFAAGFFLAAQVGLGGFESPVLDSWMDLFYFSLINITTLGLGDIYPTGHLRAITGIESLTGFLLISCTAQFVYATMNKEERLYAKRS
tara:strand:+ start:3127 stop:3579 length:453 start_codon:yes stop_codon:yes gene_type:complete